MTKTYWNLLSPFHVSYIPMYFWRFHYYRCYIFLCIINVFFFVFDHYCSLHLNCLRKCHQQSAGLSAVSLTGQCHPGAEYVLSSDNRGDSGMWDGTQGKNCRGSLINDFCLFLISVLSLGTLYLLTALYIVLRIMIFVKQSKEGPVWWDMVQRWFKCLM